MIKKTFAAAGIAACLIATTGFAQDAANSDNDNRLDKGIIQSLQDGTLTASQKSQLRAYLLAGGATAAFIAGAFVVLDDDGNVNVILPGNQNNGGGNGGTGGTGTGGTGGTGTGGTGGTGTGGTGGTGTGGTGGTGTGATGT